MRGVAILVVCLVLMQGLLALPSQSMGWKEISREELRQYHVSRNSHSSKITNPSSFHICSSASKNVNPSSMLSQEPMDSPWPMFSHDVRHTGQSPYNATAVPDVKWKFETVGFVDGGPTIDKNGTIYFGEYGLYATYPNGTLK